MFSIGEFSRITGLTVKTLRFYHEKGLLVPALIDKSSGYRYYDRANIEKARLIVSLRDMELSISDIGELLDRYDDQAQILDFLQSHKQQLEERIRSLTNITESLDYIIKSEQEAAMTLQQASFVVEEKDLQPLLIASVRMKGKYSDCGKGFSLIGKKLGRYIYGKPFCLYYDGDYRPDDADLEACIPIKREKQIEGISVRTLPGGSCLSLLHKGPYDELGRSYEIILGHAKDKGYEIVLPTREVYIKGPGMLFKGNPKNYLTEIQLPIQTV